MKKKDSRNERRKHPRVPVALPVRRTTGASGDVATEHATDVSEGGAFIRTQRTMPIGATLDIDFVAPGDVPRELHAKGQVVRVTKDGMAVAFTELDFDSRLLLNYALSVETS